MAKKVSNQNSFEFIAAREPFNGSNFSGEYLGKSALASFGAFGVFSYNTIMAVHVPGLGWYKNPRKYSRTTSKQLTVSGLRELDFVGSFSAENFYDWAAERRAEIERIRLFERLEQATKAATAESVPRRAL
jgi:hypothetical protein